ncbi:MAG: 1-deoxy-D-xylulose-5-phosphate reductoisomerase [Thermodesulfobacteriota bacterium]
MDYISALSPEKPLSWPRSLTVLGSTGSIGTNALNVIREHRESFQVVALAGARNIELLAKQALEFRPLCLGVLNADMIPGLKAFFPADYQPEIFAGSAGYAQLAGLPEAGMVLCAQVGASGLLPAYTAVGAGKVILLANKESLVLAGTLLRERARRSGAVILPVDSEHNAVFQCLDGESASGLSRILLTASGGPFRTWSREQLSRVTRKQALDHPNWSMGAKISVDSATMMNKGLEVIEAHHLFGLPREQIGVVVHPQSIVHSLVEYRDRSVLAHMGTPDMRVPIAYCLSYPERIRTDVQPLDLARVGNLTFEDPDPNRFPCLDLALKALQGANSLPVVLNAANESAVDAFLLDRIEFMRIPQLVEHALGFFREQEINTLEDIFALDREVRVHLDKEMDK